MEDAPDYNQWSHERLVNRVTQLEQELEKRDLSPSKQKRSKRKSERPFHPAKYSTRIIALKIAYLGKNYNGFEYHANNKTPLPTIEEEVWKALNKTKLIFPIVSSPSQLGRVNWDGCEFSKCGRTDKGVSAFGQVIGIRVRSNCPLRKPSVTVNEFGGTTSTNSFNVYTQDNVGEVASSAPSLPRSQDYDSDLDKTVEDYYDIVSFDPIADEIPYPILLNQQLPPDIRVLAWCPAPPNFSARFFCKERQYRYFFTQPAFAPAPAHLEANLRTTHKPAMDDGWLNIEAMREAAKHFIGQHDFRNFCKVDPSKQLTNFGRRIHHADIVEIVDKASALGFINKIGTSSPTSPKDRKLPKVYSFDIHGTAFLWHQVRHMVAVLFFVGQGLEKPAIVSELLDIEKTPRRPMYEMAADTPLVLWDCVFPSEGDPNLNWFYIGDQAGKGSEKYGPRSLMDDLWKVWRERKIDEILASSLIDVVGSQGADMETLSATPKGKKSQRVFDGGDVPRPQGTYIPVAKKPQLESPDEIYKKYAIRKGFETSGLKAQGFRSTRISSSTDDSDE